VAPGDHQHHHHDTCDSGGENGGDDSDANGDGGDRIGNGGEHDHNDVLICSLGQRNVWAGNTGNNASQ
jgi:hypothetical protein